MKNDKTNLYNFLCKYEEIEVPDIQRDYVMGSIGEKLKELLKSMNNCAKNKEEMFNFSCIMGYEENVSNDLNQKKKFYVYDGQQRLTTLVFLAAFIICNNDQQNDKYEEQKKHLNKFIFNGRHEANNYLKMLLNGSSKTNIEICDFTTYSIKNLIKTYSESITWDKKVLYPNIDSEFLTNRVMFDLVLVDKMGDAEQFFMDLNDGVDLKDYEIYKAELNHKINSIKINNNKDISLECINKWSLKIDNEWLEYFLHYKTDNCCEEEIEINFIKYCFEMVYIETRGNSKGFRSDNLEWIETEDVQRVYAIMQNVIKIIISKNNNIEFLNYSWENNNYEDVKEIRGAYWDLSVNDYEIMFDRFIKTFTNTNKNLMENQRKYDVIMWIYLSNLNVECETRNEYLRLIKKILNKNRIINNNAIYNKDKKIYYCRYVVFGIPKYYGNTYKYDNNKVFECEKYIWTILELNWYLSQQKIDTYNFVVDNILYLWKCYINQNSQKYKDILISSILQGEKEKYQSIRYSEISEIENSKYFNGIVDNIIDNQGNILILSSDLKNLKQFDFESAKTSKVIKKLLKKYDWDIMINNINVKWKITGGGVATKSNVKVIINSLTDFFTYDHYDKNIESLNCNHYLKYYEHPSNGWIEDNNIICHPKKGLNGSFYDIYSSATNDAVYKQNIKQWFDKQFNRITKNQNNDIVIHVENIEDYEIEISKYQYIPQKHKEPLKNIILSQQNINTIYFSHDSKLNFIVLEQFVSEKVDNIIFIRDFINENQSSIIPCFDKIYYMRYECFKNFYNYYEKNI